MLIEFGHLYIDDLMSGRVNVPALQRSVTLAQGRVRPSDTLWVLLDDKALHLTDEEREEMVAKANGLLDSLGLCAHQYFFEKGFTDRARSLMQKLPAHQLQWQTFRKQEKRVLFFKEGLNSIPLITERAGIEYFSCPLLASAWRQHKQESDAQTLTILEQRYESVEQQVGVILNAAGIQEPGNHSYLWC